MPAMSWVNPCGGRRWQTLIDGRIEVEGDGIIAYKPGSVQFDQMVACWSNWSRHIRRASSEFDVPLSWIVAIMSMETGLWADDPERQASIASSAGAIGPMQIMPATGKMLGFTTAQLHDPSSNIRAGAGTIRYWLDRGATSLPEVCARYNSGRLCGATGNCGITNEWRLCAASNYPRKTIMWNNAAVESLDLGFDWAMFAVAGIVSSGLAFAIAVATGLTRAPQWWPSVKR